MAEYHEPVQRDALRYLRQRLDVHDRELRALKQALGAVSLNRGDPFVIPNPYEGEVMVDVNNFPWHYAEQLWRPFYGLQWCRAVWPGGTVSPGSSLAANIAAISDFDTNAPDFFELGDENGINISRGECAIAIWGAAVLGSIARAGTHYVQENWLDATSPIMTFSGKGSPLVVTADSSSEDPVDARLFDFGVGNSSGFHELAMQYIRIGGANDQVIDYFAMLVVRIGFKNFGP